MWSQALSPPSWAWGEELRSEVPAGQLGPLRTQGPKVSLSERKRREGWGVVEGGTSSGRSFTDLKVAHVLG